MKTTIRIALAALAVAAASSFAQPGPGTPGAGPGMGPGAGMGPGMGPGMGMGPGPGAGWRMNRNNTPGSQFMTEQERNAHRDKMRSMQTYDECVAYVAEHHQQMAARAQEKGVTLPAPRGPCDTMKARGRVK